VFYARERGHRGWQGLHAAVTDRAGWAIVVIPAQSTGTQFRVRFAGDRVDEPAASGVLGARHRAASRAGLRPALESAAGGIVFPFLDAREAQSPGGWSLDQGVDINAWGDACGSAAILVAVADGTVVQEGIAGFGPTAPVIAVSRGPLAGRYVYYGHTGTVFVPVGASVRAGQPIAEIGCGSVGNSAAPHVEIGMSWPGGPTCCPGYQATSPALFRLLAAAY
jgi:murein DD-endopeptidase MepM/ murein hydrolase activator NlpD